MHITSCWRLALLALSLLLALPSAAVGERLYESYYHYLGNRPYEGSPYWSDNTQGITHDSENWYISQESSIWKIPVTEDLGNEDWYGSRYRMEDVIPDLWHDTEPPYTGYNHLGDMDHHVHNGVGYLVTAVTGNDVPPIIIVFRSSTMSYVGHDTVKNEEHSPGWCAIDNEGYLYTSGNKVTQYSRYALDWDAVAQGTVSLQFLNTIPFLDENGNSIKLWHMQGGVFSPSGDRLYTSSGYYDDRYDNDGINVFDTTTNRRLMRSNNGSWPFNFQFTPDDYEEPEGLTIWDVDTFGSDKIIGQLHVILLDNELYDDVYIKHYSNRLYVDAAAGGAGTGRVNDPFNSIAEAMNWTLDGFEIHIASGSYAEAVTMNNDITVVPVGGVVTIGR